MPQIALAERGVEPAGQVVARVIEAILAKGQVSASIFVDTLEQAGVRVIPNIASTGKLNGFAYELNDERITATALGRGFTLGNLTKRGLTYDQDSDRKFLDDIRRNRTDQLLERPHGAPPDNAGGPGHEAVVVLEGAGGMAR